MKYADGREVLLGDRVRLGEDDRGVVVCSIDTGDYSTKALMADWSYLKRGVLVDFPKFGLVHFEVTEPDLELIARGA